MEKKLIYLLIIARKSTTERNHQMIDQLVRINNFAQQHKVFLYTHAPVRSHDPRIHTICPDDTKYNLIGEGDVMFDLIVVEDINENDIPFLTFMMRSQIPVFARDEMIARYANYLIPGKTVISYSAANPLHLPIAIVQFLRNHSHRRSFLIEAQRLANVWNINGCSDRLVIQTSEPVIHPSQNESFAEEEEEEAGETPEDVEDQPQQGDAVDLVIINYNTLSYVKQCILSIKNNTNYPHRITVVDNGSTDGSQAYLRRQKDLRVICNQDNLGYATACNQGIAAGTGEFVVILNSDIKVTKGWLTNMIRMARKDPEIGVIGPKMVNEQGLIVGAGVTELTRDCAPRGWMKSDREDLYNEPQDCYSVGGACYLIRRRALKRTGAFDQNYFFYFEETDLSLRMLEKGYRVVYCPYAKVIHYHEGSLDPRRPEDRLLRNNFFREGQARFLAKWGSVFEGNPVRSGQNEIIVFGVIPWEFRFQRPQQLVTRLTQYGYRVLYINSTCVKGGALKEVAPGIHTFSPDGESLVYHMLNNEHNRQHLINSIYRAMKELKFRQPILWVDVPYWETILQNFDRHLLVYNCMDSYGDFSDIKRYCPKLETLEEELCRWTDLLFTSSHSLQERMSQKNSNTHLIPNGVDRAFFSMDQHREMPPDLHKIAQPIAGYYGAIAEWFDQELLYETARQLPEVNFVFIGHQTVNVDRLRSLTNVFFLGEKPYFDLPKYLAYFQVALIPFKINTLTLATNPVKVYEYLAGGKPVVSVRLPELLPFSEVISFADDNQSFAAAIQEALNKDGWWPRRKRVKAVEEEDWDFRVTAIVKRIEEYKELMRFQSKFPELERVKKSR